MPDCPIGEYGDIDLKLSISSINGDEYDQAVLSAMRIFGEG